MDEGKVRRLFLLEMLEAAKGKMWLMEEGEGKVNGW